MGIRILDEIPGVQWSAYAVDLMTGHVLFEHDSGQTLRTASMGKTLLLIEVARLIAVGELDPAERLVRAPADAVADSGLWQHLATDALSVADAATFIGAVSDNLATNVLLSRLGLEGVDRVPGELGVDSVRLLDKVRDIRTPDDPPALSVGSAADLVTLFGLLAAGKAYTPAVSKQVVDWLVLGTDLSMVASAFALDPLAHVDADRGYLVINKTGTNAGVRADAGVVHGVQRSIGYAVLANGEMIEGFTRDAVLAAMRELGMLMREEVGRA